MLGTHGSNGVIAGSCAGATGGGRASAAPRCRGQARSNGRRPYAGIPSSTSRTQYETPCGIAASLKS
jgi:hypothetical protein